MNRQSKCICDTQEEIIQRIQTVYALVPEYQEVAFDYFIHGITAIPLAKKYNLSVNVIYGIVRNVRINRVIKNPRNRKIMGTGTPEELIQRTWNIYPFPEEAPLREAVIEYLVKNGKQKDLAIKYNVAKAALVMAVKRVRTNTPRKLPPPPKTITLQTPDRDFLVDEAVLNEILHDCFDTQKSWRRAVELKIMTNDTLDNITEYLKSEFRWEVDVRRALKKFAEYCRANNITSDDIIIKDAPSLY